MAYTTPSARIVAAHPYATTARGYRVPNVYPSRSDVRIFAADQFIREQYLNHQYPHYVEQQTAVLGATDTVATTTKSVAGPAGTVHHSSVAGSSTQPQQLPENAIYYMGMSSGVNYVGDPYMQGYADATYRPGAYTSYPTGSFYGPSHSYNQHYGTSYMHYPQPSPPNRRSRTAPSRTLPRGASGGSAHIGTSAYPTAARRPRGASVDAAIPTAPNVMYHAYLAPGKRPVHMYRRSRASYHEGGAMPGAYGTAASAATVTDYHPFHTVARPINRTPSIYQPSYTSYPPAQMQFKERENESDPNRYPLWLRCSVKSTQLILGAAILGLVLGPMRNTSLIDFVTTTRTEWQGLVVGLVGAMSIATLILLISCFFAHKNSDWRKVDAHASVFGFILYLIAACLESYYAACYPPNGPIIKVVCHRAEWIIATILCFINVILYVIDFVLAWMAGVVML